ncbi:hypothetical protein FPSE_00291 [Fusarium pseudograminearum CS3096]|uniref:Uncharacterized protein n=1 Tax=Fusarium pseudograminearum (strain CS3096) TaxID=1028729 RepID=K3V2T4_FUSPC|nr:hypothetical protein FPSE_00291 [Fusarium pseudograminearum CS3096]EKJ79606.1 hypothetical protein FPSE_00291 [Fusarium pseudograminearum CS3096]
MSVAMWMSSILTLGFAAGLSRAGQPDGPRLLRRLPQTYDVPMPIIPITTTVHSGNASVVTPPMNSPFPTSTMQTVQPSISVSDAPSLSSGVGHDFGSVSDALTETSLDLAHSESADSTLAQPSGDQSVTVSTNPFESTETLPVTSYSTVEFPTSETGVSQDITTTWSTEGETHVSGSSSNSGEGYTESGASSQMITDSDSLSTTSIAVTTGTEVSLSMSQPTESTGSLSSAVSSETSDAIENSETIRSPSTQSRSLDSAIETSSQTETSFISETWASMSSDIIVEPSESVIDSTQTYTSSDGPVSQAPSGITGSGDVTSLTVSSTVGQPSGSLETPSEPAESSLASDQLAQPTKAPTTKEHLAPALTSTGDMVVTGTDGTIATYVPEQDSSYASSTETITTTDDNGDNIIIFPFGWFWKLDGGKGGAGVVKPPAPTINPGMVNQPDEKEGDEDEDDDKNEDDASTKDGDTSTVDSTVSSTTEWPTTTTTSEPETTTTEECTAMTQPDCTRTVSYMTSDGTKIMTEFGDCPTIVSCATETQATATVTLSELIWAGGVIETPLEIIPEDALTAEVDHDLMDALEDEWAKVFDGDDSVFPRVGNATDTAIEKTATETETLTAETSTDLALTTDLAETITTESGSSFASITPSTLVTRTKVSSNTLEVTRTTGEAVQTYFPCVIHGGPAVETPYCQCSTTIDGQGYYATTTLVDDKCIAYTEFPSEITSAPPSGPITEEPVQEPITTTTAGTVLVWSAYVLEYINIAGVTRITHSVGVGQPSTVSTPLPSQTAVDNDGGGQCGTADSLSKQGLREACDRAIDQFEDGVVYTGYASRYSRSDKGILMPASFGKAACVAKFECDHYGIGMAGSDIKAARESANTNDGIGICGHVYLSNSCKVVMDYCTNCKTRG